MKLAYKFNTLEQRDTLVNRFGEDYFDYIPTDEDMDYAQSGYMFHNSGSACWTSGEPVGFKLIPFEMTIDDQIKLAKSYIGKTVKYGPSGVNTYKVDDVKVYVTAESVKNSSYSANLEFDKSGFVVVVSGQGAAIPVMDCSLPESTATVKLNDTYNAIVSKDTIRVGCQTFPITILDELFQAHKAIS